MATTHKSKSTPRRTAVTRNLGELFWTEYPGHHHQALSKAIVTPQLSGSRYFDHRISCYEPGAFVESHVHKIQEQIYHFLSGEGVLITDGERRVVHARGLFESRQHFGLLGMHERLLISTARATCTSGRKYATGKEQRLDDAADLSRR